MQMEMEAGGRLFFDLFVAMVNHMVCIFQLYSAGACKKDINNFASSQDDISSAKSPY